MTFDVRIGINPISWTNDDLPSLGDETPLETALAEGKAIGYEGFELGNKFPREPDALRAVLARHGLACVSGWYSGRLARGTVVEEIAAVDAHLRLLAANGADVMVYGEVADSIQGRPEALSRRPRFRSDADWDAYGERVTEFARYTRSRGVRLAYHHHMGAYVETAEDVDRLMQVTGPDVGLLHDTGHVTFADGDAPTELAKHVARVVHVHCKDVRPAVAKMARNRGWSFLEAVINGAFSTPGEGCVDFAAVIAVLRNAGYRGWLVVEGEQDPAVAPPYRYADMAYWLLRALVDGRAPDPRIEEKRMSRLIVKAAREGRTIARVTPESAGWRYVGFEALRLSAGETHAATTGARELCIVVIAGTVAVESGDVAWGDVGERQSPFDDVGPCAIYLPPGRNVRITGASAAEIALCSAPATKAIAPRLIEPATMRRIVRGQGSNTRYVRDILPQDEPAESLLIVEVITPAGHSSSYPPHKHDTDAAPAESLLEETYYHRLDPPQGFAFQRVYTDDRSLDETMTVENGDVVMVPRGYHPVVVPHGYTSYYLNVMAGPRRVWHFHNDPAHEWMLGRMA